MVESRISPDKAGKLPEEQLQHFRFRIKHHNCIERLDEFGKSNVTEYKRERMDDDLDLVSLWKFGSGFGTTDLVCTFDNVYF